MRYIGKSVKDSTVYKLRTLQEDIRFDSQEKFVDIVRDFLEKIRKFRSLQSKELKNVLLDTPKEREH